MRHILFLLLAIASVAGVRAQEPVDSLDYLRDELDAANAELAEKDLEIERLNREKNWNSIWGKGKYTMLSYAPTANVKAEGLKEKASFSFAITKGNSYFFPKRPIAGLLKVGFDVRWTDIQVTKYKKRNFVTSDNWNADGGNTGGDDDYGDILSKFNNLGVWDLHIGAFGIGPVVSVAPFSMMDNAAKYLRATLYFHYQPTFGLHLVSDEGDINSSMAYCNIFDFGGKIQYRRVALGVESRWGSGKYSQIAVLNSSDDEDSRPKIKRDFSSFRVYIAFTL